MKLAIAAFMVLAAATANVVVAQEGSGHGPPSTPIIVAPTLPTPTLPAPAPKTLEPVQR